MENETSQNNTQIGEIIDIISANEVHPSTQSQNPDIHPTLMYRVGDSEIFIIIERDSNFKMLFVNCINHTGKGTEIINITDKEQATNILNACEKKLDAQKKERKKLEEYEQKLAAQKRKEEKLRKEAAKLERFKQRFGNALNPQNEK